MIWSSGRKDMPHASRSHSLTSCCPISSGIFFHGYLHIWDQTHRIIIWKSQWSLPYSSIFPIYLYANKITLSFSHGETNIQIAPFWTPGLSELVPSQPCPPRSPRCPETVCGGWEMMLEMRGSAHCLVVYIYIYICMCLYIYIYVCMYIYIYVYVCVCVFLHMYVIWLSTMFCVCVFVYMYVIWLIMIIYHVL